ncbi:MAG: hypothetical protein ABIP94_09015 [Planctomycetota bacterium]
MKAFLRLSTAAAVLCHGLVAQFVHGTVVPRASWQSWVQGEPVPIGGDAAPMATVYAFYTRPTHAAEFSADGDYLAELQRRHEKDGLVVVAVVRDAKVEGAARWPGCRIVADGEDATATAWLGDAEWPWNIVVVDRSGVLVFFGSIESGLVDATEAALQGRDVLDAERLALAARQDLPMIFDDVVAAQARSELEKLLVHAPRDGVAWGLFYLTQATKFTDVGAAKKVRQQALERLAAEPRPLAAFASLAMRGDAQGEGLIAALVAPLQAAAVAAPHDVVVQLAYLRALVLTGADRDAGRQAMRMRKQVSGSAEHCLEFAAVLTADKSAVVHRDLATSAIERAMTLGAPPRLLAAARYGVAVRCAEDPEQGKLIVEQYLGDNEQRVEINNDCWYFLTQLPTMGRCDWFATGLAERMLEQREAMDYFEFDTVALAMFLVGRTKEAVELQQAAIEKGGKGNPEYVERLRRYKARVAPAPR